jgi:hypothetical protein
MRAHILGGLIASCVLLATGTALAHHSFAAEFDANKPITLKGRVTKVEWTNPTCGSTSTSRTRRPVR